MNSKYEKIINMSRPISEKHPRMGRLKRAAQFRPCLMQSGYEYDKEPKNEDTDIYHELFICEPIYD